MIKINFYSKKIQEEYIDRIKKNIEGKRKTKNIKSVFYSKNMIDNKKLRKYLCDKEYFEVARNSKKFTGSVLECLSYDKTFKLNI